MLIKNNGRIYCLMTVILLVVISFLNSGCSSIQTKEMALRDGVDTLNMGGGAICLLTLKTDNQYKPEWPPEVYGLEIVDQATNKKMNIAVQSMSMGSLIKKGLNDTFTAKKDGSVWEGLISFHLPVGSYSISAVRGGCTRGIGIAAAMASFDFPFDTPFEVNAHEYVYLGRIEMINRERKSEDEIPSGDNTITRIPQKQSGFGTGTFDVQIYDNYDQDIKSFTEKFPVLNGKKIAKHVLPAWSKPER